MEGAAETKRGVKQDRAAAAEREQEALLEKRPTFLPIEISWNAGVRNRYRNEPGRESGGKNFVDLRGELKIEIADALNAVGIEIDDHLVPDVEPLRMMIYRFGNESDLGHPAKSGDEVLALKRFVQFAVDEGPAVRGLELNLDFGVGEFLRFHGSPPVAGRK